MRQFDVTIVGAGHGGAQAAIAAAPARLCGLDRADRRREPGAALRTAAAVEGVSHRREAVRADADPPGGLLGRARRRPCCPAPRVTAVDPAAKSVTIAGGEAVGYGALVWATGGVPRRLGCAGGDLAGVHVVRARPTSTAILAELPGRGGWWWSAAAISGSRPRRRCASSASEVCCSRRWTACWRASRARRLSRFFEAEHRAHGVDLRLRRGGSAIEGDGDASPACAATGETLAAT